jgi:hypothetical protein
MISNTILAGVLSSQSAAPLEDTNEIRCAARYFPVFLSAAADLPKMAMSSARTVGTSDGARRVAARPRNARS